ncbi:unnamed protein product [Prunus armeniaca]|uniref:Uncharacterized protein n=1 Tax=Prunus armeniaca TaxID=36596 RepID=A0A6J5U0Z9_PRUAR|nr:unnamed protein product [Prunus armeniaca]
MASEKKGLRDRPTYQMNSFRQALVDCDLHSVPYQGYPFTWARTYPSGDMVEERLDSPHRGGKEKRRFHFEQMWTLEKGCEDIIREARDSTDAMGGVKEGIKNCAGKLAKWNKLTFGHVQKQLAAAHKELEVLQGEWDKFKCY